MEIVFREIWEQACKPGCYSTPTNSVICGVCIAVKLIVASPPLYNFYVWHWNTVVKVHGLFMIMIINKIKNMVIKQNNGKRA